MPQTREKGGHCRGQAAECATAATAAALWEIREAYLNLEQGWMELAREFEEMPELPAASSDGGPDKGAKLRRRAATARD
jgi:hypothetical protein